MASLTQTTGSVTSVHTVRTHPTCMDHVGSTPLLNRQSAPSTACWWALIGWWGRAQLTATLNGFPPVPYKGNAYSFSGQLSSRSGRTHTVMEQNHKQDGQSDVFAGFKTAFKSFATEAIHVGQEPEQWKSMAVVPPISLSTTFKQNAPGNHSVSSLPACLGYLKQGVRRLSVSTCLSQTML